jgi:hypothetical protein
MAQAAEIASCAMIYMPNLMTFLFPKAFKQYMFCLSSSKGCNIGITDGKDLRSAQLRWFQMA